MTNEQRLELKKLIMKRQTDQNIAMKEASACERTAYCAKAHDVLTALPWHLRAGK